MQWNKRAHWFKLTIKFAIQNIRLKSCVRISTRRRAELEAYVANTPGARIRGGMHTNAQQRDIEAEQAEMRARSNLNATQAELNKIKAQHNPKV